MAACRVQRPFEPHPTGLLPIGRRPARL